MKLGSLTLTHPQDKGDATGCLAGRMEYAINWVTSLVLLLTSCMTLSNFTVLFIYSEGNNNYFIRAVIRIKQYNGW